MAMAMFIAMTTMSNAYALSECRENLDISYCEGEEGEDEISCEYGGDTGRTLAEAQAIADAWKECDN